MKRVLVMLDFFLMISVSVLVSFHAPINGEHRSPPKQNKKKVNETHPCLAKGATITSYVMINGVIQWTM